MLSECIDYLQTIKADENYRIFALSKICEYLPVEECDTDFPIKLLAILENEEIRLNNGCSYHTLVHKLYKNGEEVELTPTESRIMDVLSANKDKTIPSQALADIVWGYSDDTTILRVNIGRLRNRVGCDIVVGIKGKGYKLNQA